MQAWDGPRIFAQLNESITTRLSQVEDLEKNARENHDRCVDFAQQVKEGQEVLKSRENELETRGNELAAAKAAVDLERERLLVERRDLDREKEQLKEERARVTLEREENEKEREELQTQDKIVTRRLEMMRDANELLKKKLRDYLELTRGGEHRTDAPAEHIPMGTAHEAPEHSRTFQEPIKLEDSPRAHSASGTLPQVIDICDSPKAADAAADLEDGMSGDESDPTPGSPLPDDEQQRVTQVAEGHVAPDGASGPGAAADKASAPEQTRTGGASQTRQAAESADEWGDPPRWDLPPPPRQPGLASPRGGRSGGRAAPQKWEKFSGSEPEGSVGDTRGKRHQRYRADAQSKPSKTSEAAEDQQPAALPTELRVTTRAPSRARGGRAGRHSLSSGRLAAHASRRREGKVRDEDVPEHLRAAVEECRAAFAEDAGPSSSTQQQ